MEDIKEISKVFKSKRTLLLFILLFSNLFLTIKTEENYAKNSFLYLTVRAASTYQACINAPISPMKFISMEF